MIHHPEGVEPIQFRALDVGLGILPNIPFTVRIDKGDLSVGDEIEVVLQFRDHEDMTIKVPVQEAMEHEHEH